MGLKPKGFREVKLFSIEIKGILPADVEAVRGNSVGVTFLRSRLVY